MAGNLNLAQILAGIAALTTAEDISIVLEAVREKGQQREPYRHFTEEEKRTLAQGNTAAMMLMNDEAFDYSNVPKRHLIMAKKWFNAPKPSTDTRGEHAKAYHQWRVWNWKRYRFYKGHIIMGKATGQPASSSSAKDEHVEEESEGEESEGEKSDDDEAVAALVEALEVK
jgi:hypothetical protein